MKRLFRAHIRKESLTRDRLTMLAVLLAVVVLVTGSLHVSRRISQNRLQEAAMAEAQLQAKSLEIITRGIFAASEWIVSSFLCGFADVSPAGEKESEHFNYTIPDKVIHNLSADAIGRSLRSLLTYNYEYFSFTLILEPGVVDWAPDGTAISARDSLPGWTDLMMETDILNSSFYKKVSEGKSPRAKNCSAKDSSILAYASALPLFDERGKFIGEFWADAELDEISVKLKKYKNKNDRFVCLISEDGGIAACSESEFNGRGMDEMLASFYHRKIGKNWYDRMLRAIRTENSGVIKSSADEESAITYYTTIPGTDLIILISKSADAIFSESQEFLRIEAWISILTTLLIALILIPVFLKFKKENDLNRRMQNELAIAASIQSGILPPNPGTEGTPAVSGADIYGFQKQAKSVGGDLYDYVAKGRLLHFCIGDISGKGIPAALMMTQVCSLYRNRIKHEDDPGVIVRDLNDANIGRDRDKFFCTMFAGVMNLETGHVDFCNAGHNPPMVCRKESGEVDFIKAKPNMPVFAFDGYDFSKGEIELRRGDKLILYTDGVTEAQNGNRFFGNDAMIESIKDNAGSDNKSMVRNLLDRIQKFTAGTPQSDDLTILCIEYKGYGNND